MKFFTFFLLSFAFITTDFKIVKERPYNDWESTQDISGQYRLNYISDKGSGWSYDHKEELLNLNKDSTFVLRLISQGGFEVYPDSGTWSIKETTIFLKTKLTQDMIDVDFVPPLREFKVLANGLIEPNCRDKRLRKTVWKKE